MRLGNRRRWIVCLGASAFALMLQGCGKTLRVEEWRLEPPAPTERAAGPAVDVDNFRGRVEVRVLPRATTAHIVSKVVSYGDPPGDALADIDSAVHIDAELEQAEAPILRVRTSTDRAAADHGVDVVVTLPACSGVRVRTAGGGVTLVGVDGAVHVENVDGPIELRTDHAMTDPVALVTTRGNVYYQVPPESAGRFEVESLDGRVTWEGFERGVVVTAPMRAVRDRYTITINGGENPVLLRTGKGDVHTEIIPGAQSRLRSFR